MIISTAEPLFGARWVRQLLGRLLLRFCPVRERVEACADCHLRVLCRCAQADLRAAAAVERRFWIALAACGGITILFALAV